MEAVTFLMVFAAAAAAVATPFPLCRRSVPSQQNPALSNKSIRSLVILEFLSCFHRLYCTLCSRIQSFGGGEVGDGIVEVATTVGALVVVAVEEELHLHFLKFRNHRSSTFPFGTNDANAAVSTVLLCAVAERMWGSGQFFVVPAAGEAMEDLSATTTMSLTTAPALAPTTFPPFILVLFVRPR